MPSTPRSSPSDTATSPVAALFVVLVLAAGALGVGLLSAPYKSFDLDRFFVPKELVLHVAAMVAAAPLLVRRGRMGFAGMDALFAIFLGLSVVSGVFATNHWLAARALAVTWSSLLVFWSATAVASGQPRRERAMVAVLVVAVLATSATALAQAYGVDSVRFSLNRAPGGTLGNRNFVAHLAAIATPLLVIAAVGARRRFSALVATAALAVVSAVLVLSRTRAAWLALAACVVVLLPGVWRARRRWQVAGMRRRLLFNGAIVALTVAGAAFLPNSLDWRSKSPYLDSVKSVADYTSGSGRGRLVQYTNSIKLGLRHPLLGVGPGNWAVAYPAVVKPNDPSISDETGMTDNPWPSSDWMAWLSERGLVATAAFALAWLLLLADAAGQMLAAEDVESYLRGLALAGVVIATAVVGLFDAVLLLPAPALIVFAAVGALRSPPSRCSLRVSGARRGALMAVVLVAGAAATARSALMLDAMRKYESGAVAAAAREDPGSYRIQMRLANADAARGRCDLVRLHAGAAHDLYPHAPEPRRLLAACGRSAGH
ncbi:MAG: O-antigen ligase family protein [Gemmatimonadota bacterium]|nr:O-antigen ligase family protein [Gemmatimonadota bacterium]